MQLCGRRGKSDVHGSGGREGQTGAFGHELKLQSTVEFLLSQETLARLLRPVNGLNHDHQLLWDNLLKSTDYGHSSCLKVPSHNPLTRV